MTGERPRGVAGRFARTVRLLRWPLLALWIAGAVLAATHLPTIHDASTGAVGALIPKDADAIKAEVRSKTEFGFPLLSRTLLVERNPNGLSVRDQAGAIALAAQLSRGKVRGFSLVRGAIPVTNALGAPPFSRERSTTALTYLFLDPDLNTYHRTQLAQRLADRLVHPSAGTFVGVTGQAPARVKQTSLIEDNLPWIELATVLLVALAVGLRFRAVGAPLVTLGAVAVGYLVASRAVAWLGERAGFSVPQEVEPVMVVLVFGVVTDYSVFYLSRVRALLADGVGRLEAAERATAELSPIIFTAGVTVIAGTASLLVAQLQFFRIFGPGLAFSVLVSLVVAMTFIPAVLATFGRVLFWPRRPQRELASEQASEEPPQTRGRRQRNRALRIAANHPWITVAVSLAILGAAASGLKDLRLSNPVIRGLPAGANAREAYMQASQGFAPGILSPTVLVVSDAGITSQRTELARLQNLLAQQPGVALVLGPAQQPIRNLRLGATLSRTGTAARYFVVLDHDPLGAGAIADLRELKDRMPGLLRLAGLRGAEVAYAGDTALSAETIDKTVADLKRITPTALAAIFLILAIFLRALVAPLYLVAASVVAFGAALGLGTYVFEDLLGYEGITYFVPFAVAVLLVSLGSDYNVFLIGRIWQEARDRPLRESVVVAGSRAARSITLAGLVLAGSFGLLAIVPVRPFYEIALMMTAGLLLDAFVVRTVLVPALVTIVGPRSGWPGKRLVRTQTGPARPR